MVQRGDIYYIKRSFKEEGSEQHAGRPAVIVSNNANNSNSPTVEVVYLTTQPKAALPTHCLIMSSNKRSTALCEQVSTVHRDRLDGYIGTVTTDEMQGIEACLLRSLDLPVPRCQTPTESLVAELDAVKAERDMLKRHYDELVKMLVGGAR